MAEEAIGARISSVVGWPEEERRDAGIVQSGASQAQPPATQLCRATHYGRQLTAH
jgi:hypothetical protein